MDTTNVGGPATPAELMALDPGVRLQFFVSVQTTTPIIAALVIRTVLEDVRPTVARAYYERLRHLIDGADPLEVYLLAARYINTAGASRERLPLHQYFSGELNRMLEGAGLTYAYVRFGDGLQFFGSLARRTAVVCSSTLAEDDMVVYSRRGILPKQRAQNGRWPEVRVQRVELKDRTLPDTFGL